MFGSKEEGPEKAEKKGHVEYVNVKEVREEIKHGEIGEELHNKGP